MFFRDPLRKVAFLLRHIDKSRMFFSSLSILWRNSRGILRLFHKIRNSSAIVWRNLRCFTDLLTKLAFFVILWQTFFFVIFCRCWRFCCKVWLNSCFNTILWRKTCFFFSLFLKNKIFFFGMNSLMKFYFWIFGQIGNVSEKMGEICFIRDTLTRFALFLQNVRIFFPILWRNLNSFSVSDWYNSFFFGSHSPMFVRLFRDTFYVRISETKCHIFLFCMSSYMIKWNKKYFFSNISHCHA